MDFNLVRNSDRETLVAMFRTFDGLARETLNALVKYDSDAAENIAPQRMAAPKFAQTKRSYTKRVKRGPGRPKKADR